MSRFATAIFGCGCFWHKEHLFGRLHGVKDTRVGFMGGWAHSPTYQEVCAKGTGHAEVVEVTYDTHETRFPQLLKAFFSFHDATRDRTVKGGQYRSVVFYRKAKERIIAERAIELLRQHGVDVTTQVLPAQIFWEAEQAALPSAASAKPSAPRLPLPDVAALNAMSYPEAAALDLSAAPAPMTPSM